MVATSVPAGASGGEFTENNSVRSVALNFSVAGADRPTSNPLDINSKWRGSLREPDSALAGPAPASTAAAAAAAALGEPARTTSGSSTDGSRQKLGPRMT